MIGIELARNDLKSICQSTVVLSFYSTCALLAFAGPILYKILGNNLFYVFSGLTALLVAHVWWKLPSNWEQIQPRNSKYLIEDVDNSENSEQ